MARGGMRFSRNHSILLHQGSAICQHHNLNLVFDAHQNLGFVICKNTEEIRD